MSEACQKLCEIHKYVFILSFWDKMRVKMRMTCNKIQHKAFN